MSDVDRLRAMAEAYSAPPCKATCDHHPCERDRETAAMLTRAADALAREEAARAVEPLKFTVALVDPGVDDWSIVTLHPDEGFIFVNPFAADNERAARAGAAARLRRTAQEMEDGDV